MTDPARPPTDPDLRSIGVPLLVELALGIGVGLVATALAGRLGDVQGAALGLAGQAMATLFVLFRIVGAGVAVVVSQALGARRPAAAAAAARATLGASTWIGGACALAAVVGAGPLLAALAAPPDVAAQAAPLLRALGLAMVVDGWVAVQASVLRAHLHARPTLRVVLAMHATALLLTLAWMRAPGDDLLAWGLMGHVAALAASRLLAFAWLARLWRARCGLALRASDFVRWRGAALDPVLAIGLPGAAENIAWRFAFTASIAVVGRLGTVALAAHTYVTQLLAALMLFGVAVGLASEIVVGHLVGRGALRAARARVRGALAVGVAVSITLSTLAALAGPSLMALFTRDAAVVALGVELLWLTPALESGRTFNLVLVNALRGAGDARFPVLAGAASFVFVLAGGSWLLGWHLGWGLPGVFVAYAADEWCRGLIMAWRWQRGGWVPHARRARRRVRGPVGAA